MVDLSRQCADLQHAGHEVILCTSGAIAAGRERLGYPELTPTVATKQMLAAVGQSRLMLMWERFFEIYGLNVGQLLLTHGDVASRGRFLNAQDALQTLIEHKIIPIINENDAVGTDEIKIGDNDNLSALVAVLADADLLILLTDQPGLFTADPRRDPEARLIAEVRVIDEALRGLAGGSQTGLGVGGMVDQTGSGDDSPACRYRGSHRQWFGAQCARADRCRRASGDTVSGSGHAAGEPQTLDTCRRCELRPYRG